MYPRSMNRHPSAAGYTVVEIMIALGIIVLLSGLAAQVYQTVLGDTQKRQLASTRDQIVLQIRQSASSLKGLKNSLKQPGNEQFYNCVCGQGTGCNSGQIYAFNLYDLPDTPPALVPLYYDVNGSPCDPNAKNCLIKVTMNFIAQCMPTLPSADPSPPASCVGQPVEFFGILFKVQQNPLTVAEQGNLLKTVGGTAYTQVANFAPAGSGVCP